MKFQKYAFTVLMSLFFGAELWAQCLTLPNAVTQQLGSSNSIIEGKVVDQQTFAGADGNIYTTNSIDVYRVFKGDVGFSIDVITEGGVFGDLMQVVTPSAQMNIGDYGVLVLENDNQRSLVSLASGFFPVDERTGNVYGIKNVAHREALYEVIARSVGTQAIELRRLPADVLHPQTQSESRNLMEVASIFPLQVTAGTRTTIIISGAGFGADQGSGYVAFHNADDGGQSFVALQSGPHYLSWSDTQIELYVPSATLYNSVVAGTGLLRVVNADGQAAMSTQPLTVEYAKSEVIYSDQLNNTMLVGMQNGGYAYQMNNHLAQLTQGTAIVPDAFMKWACNTGVNFYLEEEVVNITDWAHDGINLIGLSYPGQLPSYLLGKTITTFSGCGSPNGIQWNLIEVDILINNDIDWWIGEGQPMIDRYDLATAILHEIGHAHLLQHNNELSSPMYFQLMEGAMRRDLHDPSIDGGNYVSTESAESAYTCGEEIHQYFDFSTCNLSVINGIEEEMDHSLTAFPNPFNDQITVSGDWNSKAQYSVLDALGRTILSGSLNSNLQVINTTELSNGVYFLQINDGSQSLVERLIKN
ncbi:MAG: T9SS type A sorting domain-containing protein [Flavobacteriales bacterium]|nr:T9SS type A sorting domain-containing protein [Flavobacteriales bacterium]